MTPTSKPTSSISSKKARNRCRRCARSCANCSTPFTACCATISPSITPASTPLPHDRQKKTVDTEQSIYSCALPCPTYSYICDQHHRRRALADRLPDGADFASSCPRASLFRGFHFGECFAREPEPVDAGRHTRVA